MSFSKYASFDVAEILDIKGAPTRQRTASLERVADFENYRTSDGFLYVRLRAISSRTNKNNDSWPSVELAGSPDILERHHSGSGFTVEASEGNPEFGFATFLGKPVFVDHHNSNPKKARGVIRDAKLNVLSKEAAKLDPYWSSLDVDPLHLPATEVELLIEVDAKAFPKFAAAIVSGDLDGFSMGADVDYSKCSHCGHTATSADEYCSHIVMKGAHHDYKTSDGKRISKRSFEHCFGVRFFEISGVFDPADETAKAREVRSAVYKEADIMPGPPPGHDARPDPVRPYDKEIADLAMAYEMKGVDPDTAMQMAVGKIEGRGMMGEPKGHGEGYSVQGQPKQWMYDSMPRGMPPPVRPWEDTAMAGSLTGDTVDALNERYPQRPVPNNPLLSSVHLAENPLPQEMMLRAPEEIDTLRNEQLCPICGNDMEAETCQICGYVQPPKEFDNPDLDKAKQIRQEMKTQEEQQATPSTQGELSNPPDEAAPGGSPSGSPANPSAMPTKGSSTAKVRSDMHNWTPKVHPRTAARINQVERPLTASNPPVSDEPKKEVVISDQTRPVTAAMVTARELMTRAQRNHSGESMHRRTADGPTPPGDTSPKTRTDVTGVGGVDEASNDAASKADAQVDVTGIGSTGVSDVSADKTESLSTADRNSDDAGFNTDKTTEDSGPTKTFGDSDGSHSGVGEPVTHEPFPASEDGVKRSRLAYEDGPLEKLDQQGGSGNDLVGGGSANKGVQPIAEQFGDRVDVLQSVTSPSNNSGPTTTWTGTDGNGVLKQQDPITRNLPEWGGVKVPDVQLHTTGRVSFAALRLAEAELELGLITRDQKWNRLAELDQLHPQIIQAKIEALGSVKTSGLARLASTRQAGVTRLPRAFGQQTAAPDGFKRIANDSAPQEREPLSDESLDAGLFLK